MEQFQAFLRFNGKTNGVVLMKKGGIHLLDENSGKVSVHFKTIGDVCFI